jgi:hypothetical protein
MAYTQNPGRGNNSKTGHGLPTPFLQTNIEVTGRYEEGKKLLKSNIAKGNTPDYLNIDAATGAAVAKPYEKKLVTQANGDTFLVDGSGKTIEMAKYDKFDSKAVDALKAKYEKEKNYTNKTREHNKNLWNATSGGTPVDKLSEGQKQTLISLSKAKKVKED